MVSLVNGLCGIWRRLARGARLGGSADSSTGSLRGTVENRLGNRASDSSFACYRASRGLAVVLVAVVMAFSAVNRVVAATAYPTRTIHIVVNFSPGGGVDVIARLVAQGLIEAFGQSAVVENRSGAGGIIGAEYVSKAAPDGYTLLVSSGGALHTNPQLVKPRPYDSLKDFVPISELVLVPNLLITRASLPAKNIPEFLAYVRANPGKATFASSGTGSSAHISGVMLNHLIGATAVHVPYSGTAAVYPDLVAGRVDYMFDGGAAMPYVRQKALKLLATTSAQRLSLFPDTPTMIEGGVKGFVLDSIHSILAPTDTPKEIVTELNKAIVAYLKRPDVVEKIHSMSHEIIGSTPEKAAADLRAEYMSNGELIKKLGLAPK